MKIDYYNSMENAISFIEKNLTEPFTIEDVSREVFQSRWHFQRVFRLVTGYSVYEYIKKRRLAEAGSDLILNRGKIIDLALKYQYGSPEAFSRAFIAEYGKPPSRFRTTTNEHRIFPRLTIEEKASSKRYKKEDISFRPVTRKGMTILGKKYRTSMQNHQNEKDVPDAWAEFNQIKLEDKLCSRSQFPGNYGIYYEWDYEENFSILLGCQVSGEKEAAEWLRNTDDCEFNFHTIKPCSYMVFTIPGRENEDILAGWNYIYGNWIPEMGTDREYSEDFDFFDDRFFSDNPVSEIYIPIQ